MALIEQIWITGGDVTRYSQTLMDHFESPRNLGRMECPNRVGVSGVPGRGRYLLLQLKLAGRRVIEARFQSNGCGATIAAGSMLSALVTGRSLKFCRWLDAETLSVALGGLPPDKRHSATMAIDALRQALEEDEEEPSEYKNCSHCVVG